MTLITLLLKCSSVQQAAHSVNIVMLFSHLKNGIGYSQTFLEAGIVINFFSFL